MLSHPSFPSCSHISAGQRRAVDGRHLFILCIRLSGGSANKPVIMEFCRCDALFEGHIFESNQLSPDNAKTAASGSRSHYLGGAHRSD
jgi:hypothetical protein